MRASNFNASSLYRYLFNWYFQQDGTIEYEIKLTGELSTNMLSQGEVEPEFGTLVAPGVNAQHHQHMFCARLDMAVDDAQGGAALVVAEVRPSCISDPHRMLSGVQQSLATSVLTGQTGYPVRDASPKGYCPIPAIVKLPPFTTDRSED